MEPQLIHEQKDSKKIKSWPILDWGEIDYEKSNLAQQEIVQSTYEAEQAGCLVFCTHSPIVTVGRSIKEKDLWGWQGKVVKSPRGGRATYHGPSQVIIYPIVNLSYQYFLNFKKRDITNYLRLLERVLIATLSEIGIEAQQKCEKKEVNGEMLEVTGVWVGEKKIASIGIAVRKWITYHGIALNMCKDEKAFKGINPCGFSANIMTSVEEVLGEAIEVLKFKELFVEKFTTEFY